MADQYETPVEKKVEENVESTDRGLFDFLGKKEEEKPTSAQEEQAISSEFGEKVKVSEDEHKEEEHKKEEKKLHRSSSSSSSSSDEEEEVIGEDGEKIKKKKKKGLKDKIKEKISGEHKEEEKTEKHEDTAVPVEKYEETEEKKGFLDKIKEKLPGGGSKKTEEVATPPPPHVAEHEAEAKEKKGFLDKIKEKLPGYHSKTEEEKEKEKEKVFPSQLFSHFSLYLRHLPPSSPPHLLLSENHFEFCVPEIVRTFVMASSSNPDANSNRSRESKQRKKRRKLGDDNTGAAAKFTSLVDGDSTTRWRTHSEQQIYSSKLLQALRQVRRSNSNNDANTPSPAIAGRNVRETADRVLAVTAKGRSRWSRAILTGRLSLRLSQINKKHKKAKVNVKSTKKPAAAKKRLPALQRKVRVLGSLVPGCKKLPFPNLLEETTDYIAALQMQIRAMTVLTGLLTGGAGSVAAQPDRLG